MKLSRLAVESEFRQRMSAAAQGIVDHPQPSDIRPCAECRLPCACSGSLVCGCGCTPACSDAASKLSSDPDKFPIEAGIVPLVYALSCLGACHPFWSCEGHADAAGILNRLPRVWFYSRSVLYPRLITEYAAKLHVQKRTHHLWHVTVTYSDASNMDTAFSLEPNIAANLICEAAPTLASMRADIGAISDHLVAGIKASAAWFLADTSEAG
jgi:hypothetical protein